jgi:hypothetical protein
MSVTAFLDGGTPVMAAVYPRPIASTIIGKHGAAPHSTPFSGATQPHPGCGSKKLLDFVRDCLRAKHYSYRTEQAYVHWIRRRILVYRKRQRVKLLSQEISRQGAKTQSQRPRFHAASPSFASSRHCVSPISSRLPTLHSPFVIPPSLISKSFSAAYPANSQQLTANSTPAGQKSQLGIILQSARFTLRN